MLKHKFLSRFITIIVFVVMLTTAVANDDYQHLVVATISGDVQLTRFYGDIKHLGEDAELEIAERKGNDVRRVQVSLDELGQLKYDYFENDVAKPFGKREHRWYRQRFRLVIQNLYLQTPARHREEFPKAWWRIGNLDMLLIVDSYSESDIFD